MTDERKEPMWGAMAEADFATNRITFDMRGAYVASAGLFAIIPQAEYEALTAALHQGEQHDA